MPHFQTEDERIRNSKLTLFQPSFEYTALYHFTPYTRCLTLKTARSKTTVDRLHLKVDEDISLTRNDCITVSTEKISSIHKFIFKMQQILGSHQQTGSGNS